MSAAASTRETSDAEKEVDSECHLCHQTYGSEDRATWSQEVLWESRLRKKHADRLGLGVMLMLLHSTQLHS